MRHAGVTGILLATLSLSACAGTDDNGGQAIEAPARAAAASQPELNCLAEAIYFEAGGAGVTGQAAVGHVILNRTRDPRFPQTVCSVVREGETAGSCQFSYRCQLDPTDIRWPNTYRVASQTAEAVLADEIPDPTDGALFFHASSIPAGWFATLERVGKFGGNVFYR